MPLTQSGVEIWRKYVTDGVPASGLHHPDLDEIQQWARELEASNFNVGSASLDFGAWPGSAEASLAVTGQAGIVSGSIVAVWIAPKDTTDHSADEHIMDPPRVYAGSIVAGTGFTIYGAYDDDDTGGDAINCGAGPGMIVPSGGGGTTYGLWNINWRWQ